MILTARDAHKSYRSGRRVTHALRGVDLDVRRGEWIAVMGPSGGGKSTLLQLLGGLDRADRGTIRLGDVDLGGVSDARRAVLRRRHVGIVFQFFNLMNDMSVAANVELPMQLLRTRRREMRVRCDELLASLGIADLANAMPWELSGGQQQRVALARALANAPDVVLADEPTGNLDSAAAAQVLDRFATEHARGQAIVMVTHDPDVAARADRVVQLHDGELVEHLDCAGAR